MQFCTCVVALYNDDTQKVHRNHFAPVSWPELDVISALHGDGSVTDIKPFVEIDQTSRDERERLSRIYGREIVEGGNPQIVPVYPGRNPSMIMQSDEPIVPSVGVRWLNPLSGDQEIIQEDGSSIPAPKGPLVIDEFNAASPGPRGVEVVGDPRPGNPDTGAVAKPTVRRSRAEKYDDTSDSPFAA